MVKEIIEKSTVKTSFNITEGKNRVKNLKNEINSKEGAQLNEKLPPYLEEKDFISKEEIIELIKSKKYGRKTEVYSILLWGVYFHAVPNKETKKELLKYIESKDFHELIEIIISEIIKSDDSNVLFKSFKEDKEFQIPGIDYAFFTKFFFFYRIALAPEKQTYLILDKWLSIAWCMIELMSNNTEIINNFYGKRSKGKLYVDGRLKNNNYVNSNVYGEYLKFMIRLSKEFSISVIELEEKLFGHNLTEKFPFNPRNVYKKTALEENIPLAKPKENQAYQGPKSEIEKKVDKKALHKEIKQTQFYLLQKPNYKAIRYSKVSNKRRKAGRIESRKNGSYLYLKKDLLNSIETDKNEWEDIIKKKSEAGHFKKFFKDEKSAIKFLEIKGITLENIK
jgi:hypothetical protein